MRRLLVLALLLVCAAGVAAGLRAVRSDGSGGSSTSRPAAAAPVDVSVDGEGRPYDVALRAFGGGNAVVRHRRLAVLRAPTRRVVILAGEAVPYVKAGDYEPLELAPHEGNRYRVDGVWIDEPGARSDSLVGVVIHERASRVVRWRQLERAAYVTDGGVGGITTVEWAERLKGTDNQAARLYEQELVQRGRQFFHADLDGRKGEDTVVFSNGFGDGGFPSIAGYDARGRRVAIVLWSMQAPWRLAFPEGVPPPQVTEREEALAACLAGRRTVDGGRRCRRLP